VTPAGVVLLLTDTALAATIYLKLIQAPVA